MGRLQTNVGECEYREPDKLLTELFIGGLNLNDMTDEKLRDITILENIKYINLNSVKYVFFTKLESSTCQKWTKITFKTYLWADGNHMSFKIFKYTFPKTTVESLCTTKNSLVILNMDNNSNIEQLGICSVQLKHKNKVVRCRIFCSTRLLFSTNRDAGY